jgi:hypothetical protein
VDDPRARRKAHAPVAGRVMVKFEPRPTVLSTVTVPPS